MDKKENNQMQKKEGNMNRENQSISKEGGKQNLSGNGNRAEYIKHLDSCLKQCLTDIEILKSKNGSNSKNSEATELEKECQDLNKKFEDLKTADSSHFEEIKNDVETESEQLLKRCEEAIASK